jgi:hypothetical protein
MTQQGNEQNDTNISQHPVLHHEQEQYEAKRRLLMNAIVENSDDMNHTKKELHTNIKSCEKQLDSEAGDSCRKQIQQQWQSMSMHEKSISSLRNNLKALDNCHRCFQDIYSRFYRNAIGTQQIQQTKFTLTKGRCAGNIFHSCQKWLNYYSSPMVHFESPLPNDNNILRVDPPNENDLYIVEEPLK